MLLHPLQSLFSRREYPNFIYSFAWIQSTADGRRSTAASETNNDFTEHRESADVGPSLDDESETGASQNKPASDRESADVGPSLDDESETGASQNKPASDAGQSPDLPMIAYDCQQGDLQRPSENRVRENSDGEMANDAGVDNDVVENTSSYAQRGYSTGFIEVDI
jgi:hypothetical protein